MREMKDRAIKILRNTDKIKSEGVWMCVGGGGVYLPFVPRLPGVDC